MSSIDKNNAFSHLVGLIQHLNDNLHKWLTLHFSIQTALIIAIGTLIEWSSKNNGILEEKIIYSFGAFGITVSALIGIILYRNRSYLNKFVEKAKYIEGNESYIWENGKVVSGPGLKLLLTIAHVLIIFGWLGFLLCF